MATNSPRFVLRKNRIIHKKNSLESPSNEPSTQSSIEQATTNDRSIEHNEDFLNSIFIDYDEDDSITKKTSQPTTIEELSNELSVISISPQVPNEHLWYLTESNKGGYKVNFI